MSNKSVAVNDETLFFNFSTPDIYPEDFFYVIWWPDDNVFAWFQADELGNNQVKHELEPTEENYNAYVKPFVDQWQTEKDRLDAEQAAREAEYNSFENTKSRALSKLNTEFEKAKTEAYVTSSLGFKADANSTANENVNGLLVTVGEGTVSFCDYNNEFHNLNKSQLETLRSEIISNAQSLYTQKWTYRTAIEQCETAEQIEEALAQVKFTYEDFSG